MTASRVRFPLRGGKREADELVRPGSRRKRWEADQQRRGRKGLQPYAAPLFDLAGVDLRKPRVGVGPAEPQAERGAGAAACSSSRPLVCAPHRRPPNHRHDSGSRRAADELGLDDQALPGGYVCSKRRTSNRGFVIMTIISAACSVFALVRDLHSMRCPTCPVTAADCHPLQPSSEASARIAMHPTGHLVVRRHQLLTVVEATVGPAPTVGAT